ncbi:isopentenyl-diphosphate Delta-isomerase [Microbacterium sp. SORGH_AS_0888]|uniref:isopentenyl-diphosphate Delta-isomerase n=1 Tax=Microbacterium sp. SORGH_AS_0888 TaxID=3041791 RepID=UPI002781AEA4|nr:isopentenyl-diphosphate Delta-isomerase [Microbacterium sp. SORGH_AS_0888]MDQ1128213.1 isopentenyl-diphosphate delta-isomerase [Microbacterium sp. SORGH_AS_0888]
MPDIDEVVLLDEHARQIGVAAKSSVHSGETPLHLAFSCHVQRADGRVLVTRRSLQKATWPGVWTNSFCGHPRPGESLPDAVARHAVRELGLRLDSLTLALEDFRYRARDASGIVENEICPVFFARVDTEPEPDPAEVAELRWADPRDLALSVAATPWAFSPWFVLQAAELPLYRPAPAVRP